MFSSSLDMSIVKSKRGLSSCSSNSSLFSARSIEHFCLERVQWKHLLGLHVRAWKDDAIATERLAGDTVGASGVTVIANVVGAIDLGLSDLRRHDEIERLG